MYPFLTDVKNVILYHHENADGSGPFGKTWEEIPLLQGSFICVIFQMRSAERRYLMMPCGSARKIIFENKGTKFDTACVDAFWKCLGKNIFESRRCRFRRTAVEYCSEKKRDLSDEMCKNFANLFAKIIDYKSEFTSRHSLGVAENAARLSTYLGDDEETVLKMYLAGALHDIGKAAIGNDILENRDA